MTNNIKLEVGQWVELNNGEQYEVQWQRSDGRFVVGSYLVMTGDGCYRSLGPSDPLSVARILPHIKLLNGDVLFEGDYAKRRDGEIVGPLEYRDSSPDYFLVGGWHYNGSGRYGYKGRGRGGSALDLIARADPPEVKTQDEPTLWRDMTDAEKGALLLAHHEGRTIQYSWEGDTEFHDFSEGGKPIWNDKVAYRIKPAEPVRKTVRLYTRLPESKHQWISDQMDGDTHSITLPLVDGKMPTGTFTNEDGETIVVEELE